MVEEPAPNVKLAVVAPEPVEPEPIEPELEPVIQAAELVSTPVAIEPPLRQAVSLPVEPTASVLIEPPPPRARREPPPPRIAKIPIRSEANPRQSAVPPPARLRRRRATARLVRWSGEEFEGELADRVNNGITWDEIIGPQTIVPHDQAVSHDAGASHQPSSYRYEATKRESENGHHAEPGPRNPLSRLFPEDDDTAPEIEFDENGEGY